MLVFGGVSIKRKSWQKSLQAMELVATDSMIHQPPGVVLNKRHPPNIV